MKVKRNKRVEQRRRERRIVVALEHPSLGDQVRFWRRQAFPRLVQRARKTKVLELIEQDAAVQAERLQQLEQAILQPFTPPQPVLVPLIEGPIPETPDEPLLPEEVTTVEPVGISVVQEITSDEPEIVPSESIEPAARRGEYSNALPAQRVRRRLIR
jgi:hypothetical protein